MFLSVVVLYYYTQLAIAVLYKLRRAVGKDNNESVAALAACP